MVWVVGQANEDLENLAIESREHWKRAATELGFWVKQVGSLHLAYQPLEDVVLREFLEISEGRHGRRLLKPEDVAVICPYVRQRGLISAMHSPTEVVVDPREAVHAAAVALLDLGVEIRFGATVKSIEPGCIKLMDGTEVPAAKIVVCAGPEIQQLMPEQSKAAGLVPVHLQMLRLRPLEGQHLGIHLCSGLTLGHYANFRTCPSLLELRALHKELWPVQVERGIHILVSEHPDGSITVGDSHRYGPEEPVYREESIDEAILTAFDEFLPRNKYEVSQRWLGCYNTHPTAPYWEAEVEPGVWALNLFGTGMTLSFGVTGRLASKLISS